MGHLPLEKFSALIAAVYDTLLDDAGWARLAHVLPSTFGASSCLLQTIDAQSGAVAVLGASSNLGGAAADYGAYYYAIDPWVGRAPKPGHGKPMTGQELISDEELSGTEFYNDFCRPIEVFHVLGAMVPVDGRTLAAVGIQRGKKAPAFQKQDKQLLGLLLPHINRTLQHHRRLSGLRQANGIAFAGLEKLGTGVMLVNAQAKLLFANEIAHRLLGTGQGIKAQNGYLHALDPGRTEELRRIIKNASLAATGHSLEAGGVLALQRASGRPLSLLVCPLPPEVVAVTPAQFTAVIFVNDPDDQPLATKALLANYYGLTSAEARLAEALIAGTRLPDYAQQAHISLHTARFQLKQVFAKTGHHRQADFIRDVLSSPIFRMASHPGATARHREP
jgi:DNA-binding CsgD family transcriptional regulator